MDEQVLRLECLKLAMAYGVSHDVPLAIEAAGKLFEFVRGSGQLIGFDTAADEPASILDDPDVISKRAKISPEDRAVLHGFAVGDGQGQFLNPFTGQRFNVKTEKSGSLHEFAAFKPMEQRPPIDPCTDMPVAEDTSRRFNSPGYGRVEPRPPGDPLDKAVSTAMKIGQNKDHRW